MPEILTGEVSPEIVQGRVDAGKITLALLKPLIAHADVNKATFTNIGIPHISHSAPGDEPGIDITWQLLDWHNVHPHHIGKSIHVAIPPSRDEYVLEPKAWQNTTEPWGQEVCHQTRPQRIAISKSTSFSLLSEVVKGVYDWTSGVGSFGLPVRLENPVENPYLNEYGYLRRIWDQLPPVDWSDEEETRVIRRAIAYPGYIKNYGWPELSAMPTQTKLRLVALKQIFDMVESKFKTGEEFREWLWKSHSFMTPGDSTLLSQNRLEEAYRYSAQFAQANQTLNF